MRIGFDLLLDENVTIDDFNLLKVLGRGAFGKVTVRVFSVCLYWKIGHAR